jgi:hypothetical protein
MLRSVFFISEEIGYVGGQSGLMMKSLNGGDIWDTAIVLNLATITDILFISNDPMYGWASSNVINESLDNNLAITSDGGKNWSAMKTQNGRSINSIHVLVDQSGVHAWIAGYDSFGRFLRRGPGVNNQFSEQILVFPPINNKPLHGIHGKDLKSMVAVGLDGTILMPNQANQNNPWIVVNTPISNHLYDVHFLTEKVVVIVGANGAILRSVTGGTSWSSINSGVSTDLFGVHFANSQHGWAVGRAGTILHSSDGGLTWAKQGSNSTKDLYDVHFINDSTGWAVGDEGTILKYSKDPVYFITANAPCRGDTLFLTVNGAPGDSYLWSGPNGFGSTLRDPVIPNVQHGGTYSVTVTRPSGATVTVSVQVTLKEGPQVSLSNLGPVPCGTIGRTVSASSQPAGASFAWFDAQGNLLGSGNSHNFQQSGTYRIKATRDGCSTDSLFVLPPSSDGPPIVLSLSGALLTCKVDSILAQVQIGGNWSVSWTLNGQSWAQTAGAYLTQAGTYQLRVTDNQTQCFRDTSILIPEDRVSPVIGDVEVPVLDCSSALKKLRLVSPQAGLDYRWFRNGVQIGSGSEVVVQQAGTYRLVATDQKNGCSSERQIQVTQNLSPPVINGFQIITEDCAQGVFSLGALVQAPVQAWSWTRGGVFLSDVERITPLQPGLYALTVTGLNGCTASAMREVKSNELTATGTVNHRLEWLDCASGRSRIRLTLEGKSGEVSWRDPMGVSMGGGASIEVSTSGTFTARIVWEGGCETIYPVTVPSVAEDLLPTVITPNGDGDNDRLVFDLCSPGSTGPVRLTVFNRWGYVVYRNEDYRGGWPASSADAPSPGQYYYILRVGDQDWRRTLTVLR